MPVVCERHKNQDGNDWRDDQNKYQVVYSKEFPEPIVFSKKRELPTASDLNEKFAFQFANKFWLKSYST